MVQTPSEKNKKRGKKGRGRAKIFYFNMDPPDLKGAWAAEMVNKLVMRNTPYSSLDLLAPSSLVGTAACGSTDSR